ncbi:MAG: hypothetical protein ACXWUG_19600 [Polyangiales bacterium]
MVDKRKYQDRTIHTEVRTSQSFDYEVIQRSLRKPLRATHELTGTPAAATVVKADKKA